MIFGFTIMYDNGSLKNLVPEISANKDDALLEFIFILMDLNRAMVTQVLAFIWIIEVA